MERESKCTLTTSTLNIFFDLGVEYETKEVARASERLRC